MDNFVVEEQNQEGQLEQTAFGNEQDKDDKKKDINPTLLITFISVLTVISLFFAVSHWFDALKLPFAVRGDINQLNANLSLANSDVANLLALQQKDTDMDGLSDYDEQYLYQTSPYLPDTDSDGFSDAEEIENNQDPNCPAGTDCGAGLEIKEAVPALPESMDSLTTDQLRALLIEAGLSAQDVEGIDDETLVQLYQETLSETSEPGTSAFQELKAEDSGLITPDQLRALLRDQGVSDEDLNELTDEDLNELIQEIIADENFKIQP